MDINKKTTKILNSAVNLFVENGVKKTTMDELAEKANVSKVTIYKYFGDKDNMYFEIGSWILSIYTNMLFDISKTSLSVDAAMNEAISVLSDFIASNKLSLCLELASLNEALNEKYNTFKQRYMQLIMELIEEGKKKNIIKNTIDSFYIFSYIDMGISYFQYNSEYRQKMIEDEDFKRSYMEFLLSHIFSKR